jgi:hypothetical protein
MYITKCKSSPLTIEFWMRCFQDSASAEEFMQKLPQFDQEMSKKRQTAEDAGGVSISHIHFFSYSYVIPQS